MPQATPFGRIRSFVWPIWAHEVRKVLPMLGMLFFVCLNYSILRNLKDTLVVTASGAEVIPFIKVWVMLPAAVGATMLFSWLSNKFRRTTVFYSVITTFLIFFALFAFVVYPTGELLHPHAAADWLETILPAGCKGLVAMFRYWTLTGFYVISELWGTMAVTVLAWGVVNEITRMSEAPRFYSVLGIATNTATIVAGGAGVLLGQSGVWQQTFSNLILLILACGVGLLCAFRFLTTSMGEEMPTMAEAKTSKPRLSFTESLRYLAQSKHLLCILAIVLCYNLTINMVEVIWKDQLRQLHPEQEAYNLYVNYLTTLGGIISTITALLMMGIIRWLGWTKTALLTPGVLLVTTIGFFGCLFAKDTLAPLTLALTGLTPLALAVFFGSMQNCLSKAAKYSVFDTTKEMAFIPLAPDHKLKGKAAIDGIGSRLAKSGGSLVHQGLLLIFCTLSASASYVAIILIAALFVWIGAIRALGTRFSLDEARPATAPLEAVKA